MMRAYQNDTLLLKWSHFEVHIDAGWSSLVARRAHNPKVVGSNPAPATNCNPCSPSSLQYPPFSVQTDRNY
jgi:hypothetical protein